MKYLLTKLIFLFLCNILIISETKAKDSARFSVGGGIFNYMEDGTPPHNDQSQMINMEIHSGKKMFNLIKPFAGFFTQQKIHIMHMVVLESMDITERKKIGF